MPKSSNVKTRNQKIYDEAEQIAYTKAIRSFSDSIESEEPSEIDTNYSNGEIDAYVKAFNRFAVEELDQQADHLVKTYKEADAEAYNKAIKAFGGPVDADPLADHPSFEKGFNTAVKMQQDYATSYKKGEEEAYNRAIKLFNAPITSFIGDSPVTSKTVRPIKTFFKNVPESLYLAKLMQTKQVATKGMYIYQNWITVFLMTKRLYETGTEITWEGFKNYATDLSVFIEEVNEDMPPNSTKVSELPDLLKEIVDLWPDLKMIAGGARIAYDENDEEQKNPLSNRYEAVRVPDRKMEVLGDVYSKTPDDFYIYDDKDQRAVEEIKLKFKEVFRVIINMKEEIQKRSDLYDSLLKLRKSLDKLQEIFDPKILNKVVDIRNIDLGTVENIKIQLKNIYTNRYLDPQMADLVKKIDDKIDMDTWWFKVDPNATSAGDGVLHKLARNVNRVILRLNGDRIMEGLRAINAYYDQIWAAIHKGRQLISPSKI